MAASYRMGPAKGHAGFPNCAEHDGERGCEQGCEMNSL